MSMAAIEQAAAKSAQDKAKAKADAIVADIKAAPENLQKEATKAGEAALVEVRETHKSERGGNWRERQRTLLLSCVSRSFDAADIAERASDVSPPAQCITCAFCA